ncbi:MAG TPA: G5 domain-containing protein, partial [Polyangiaceae bacterium]
NLKLKNTYPFPVVLHQTVQNGTVRAEILGPKRTRAVTLIRRIDTAIPYEQVERPDPSLPSGQRALAQRGIAGFKVHRYRIIRDGNHAVRERWNDIYPPTAQIIRVGTGTNALAKAGSVKDDAAPEYLADELLVMTQGDAPAVDPAAAPASREQREPGVYGTAGWTAKAGMPFWNSTAEPTPKPRVSNR